MIRIRHTCKTYSYKVSARLVLPLENKSLHHKFSSVTMATKNCDLQIKLQTTLATNEIFALFPRAVISVGNKSAKVWAITKSHSVIRSIKAVLTFFHFPTKRLLSATTIWKTIHGTPSIGEKVKGNPRLGEGTVHEIFSKGLMVPARQKLELLILG